MTDPIIPQHEPLTAVIENNRTLLNLLAEKDAQISQQAQTIQELRAQLMEPVVVVRCDYAT